MSVGEFLGTVVSRVAGEAVTRYRIGKEGTGANAVLMADATNRPMGIITETAADTVMVGVAVDGEGFVDANGATDIAIGDALKPTTDGVAIKGATGDACACIALEAYTVDATRTIRCRIQLFDLP